MTRYWWACLFRWAWISLRTFGSWDSLLGRIPKSSILLAEQRVIASANRRDYGMWHEPTPCRLATKLRRPSGRYLRPIPLARLAELARKRA